MPQYGLQGSVMVAASHVPIQPLPPPTHAAQTGAMLPFEQALGSFSDAAHLNGSAYLSWLTDRRKKAELRGFLLRPYVCRASLRLASTFTGDGFAQLGSGGATENTETASVKPRSKRVPSGTSGTSSPISAATAASIRICPSSAAPQMRDAKFTTLPIAV